MTISTLIAHCCLFASLAAVPQDQQVTPPQTTSPKLPPRVLPRQPGDDVVEPLTRPLPAGVQKQLEAESWFMAGKVEQRAGRDEAAYRAFLKALEFDSAAAAAYRELIPLAFKLNRTREAADFARKAIALDPNDYEVLQQLAMLAAASNQLDDAVRYTEQALKSNRLEKFSAANVILNRDLMRLAAASRKMDRAAEACDVLFDALKDPTKYGLDARAQRTLAMQTDLIANVYMAAGRIDRAIEVFLEQSRVRGGRPGDHNFQLARLYFAEKKYDESERQLREFLKTHPREIAAYQLLGQILQATGRETELVPTLEELAAGDRRNAALQYFLADRYVEAGRLDEAEKLIRKAMRSSGSPAGYLGLAEIYRRQHKPKELLDVLSRLYLAGVDAAPVVRPVAGDRELVDALIAHAQQVQSSGSDSLGFAANYMLGRITAAADRSAEAIEFLQAAMKQARGGQLAVVGLDLGTQLLVADRYADAAKAFETALEQPANTDEERRRKVFLFYRLAQAREFADETEPALRALRQAQAMPEGDLPLLHYQEAWTYVHSGQLDKAEPKLQDILARYQTDPDTTARARLLLASVHTQQRKFATAISEYESILADYAGSAETVRTARMQLSGLYISKGDQPAAESILELVLKDDPDDPGVNNDLGYLYADQGKQLAKAEAMIRKAVAASPENAAYLDSLGWVLYRRGQFKEAVEVLEKAIALPGGDDSTIVEHLGDNYNSLGRTKAARQAWEKALKIESGAPYPDESVVSRLRQKISDIGSGDPDAAAENSGQ